MTGRDFGDTLTSQLPSILGNTIGNLAAGRIASIGSPRLAYADMSGDDSVAYSGGTTGTTGAGDGTRAQPVAGAGGGQLGCGATSSVDGASVRSSLSSEGNIGDIVVNGNRNNHWSDSQYNAYEDRVNSAFDASYAAGGDGPSTADIAAIRQSVDSTDEWANAVRYVFPNAHSIGFGGSAELAIGAGIHLGIAYRYDLDTGAHGGTLDWGGGVGLAASVGLGPFVSKDSFAPNAPTSTTLNSSIGGEFGPLALDGSHIWKQQFNASNMPVREPNEASFSVFGYDLLNGTASPSHKTGENITVEDGHVGLRTDTSPIIPTPSSVRDSLESVGAHAYLFNLNVHKSF